MAAGRPGLGIGTWRYPMGCGQFSWGPCPAGCSGGPWSKWSYLDRGKREGGREVQRVEGRKEDSGEGEEEEQADTRDPEQEKGQEWREVTGARSVGEKFGKRQREKVVRLPSLPWNRVVPQGLANREAGTASRSHGWKGPELGLGLFAPHSEPVSYTHLTLPTTGSLCRSRWSPYH